MGEIKLACSTAPWGEANIIQSITDISDVGFAGVECPAEIVQMYEDRLHVFEEILEDRSLELAGLIQTIDLLDRDSADLQVEKAANTARFVGAAGPAVLTVCHSYEREEPMTDEEWSVVGAVLEEIGDRCAEFNVDLCFMPRAMRLVHSEKDIKRLLASTKPESVKLCLDTAEVTLAGSNPQKIIKSCFDRIRIVRYHDVSASKKRAKSTSDKPGATPQFGRGAIKFPAVSKLLLDNGYEGWIVLDTSGETHEPIDAISIGFRFLMRKSGLYDF